MNFNFFKYHGTGNDFILIDNRSGKFNADSEIIAKLCHRRFGIGADGLMLLENSDNYDFKMRYFNSDGNEGTMCGNGGRCIVAFAKKLGLITEYTVFEAVDGIHKARVNNGLVSLHMSSVDNIDKLSSDYFLDTGSPHFVRFIDDVDEFDVYKEGRNIRYSEKFKKNGTNVNFVQIIDDNTIKVATYERGVEDETLSCGTGVTASAISAYVKNGGRAAKFNIQTKGGDLQVEFVEKNGKFDNIILSGPASFVFEGNIEI